MIRRAMSTGLQPLTPPHSECLRLVIYLLLPSAVRCISWIPDMFCHGFFSNPVEWL